MWFDDEIELLLKNIGSVLCMGSRDSDTVEGEGEYYDGEANKEDKVRVAFVLTTWFKTGGHSSLLKIWMELLEDDCEQYIYITGGKRGEAYYQDLRKALENKETHIRLLNFSTLSAGIQQLVHEIEKDTPNVLVTFIHPDDVVAVSSISVLRDKPIVIFVNHADHVFWLGRGILDYLVDFRSEGIKISRLLRRIGNSYKIPLTYDAAGKGLSGSDLLTPKKSARIELGIPEGATLSLSIGSLYKVLGAPDIDYFEVILELLKRNPDHYHILITTPSSGEIIEKQFKRYRELRERLIVKGPINDLQPYFIHSDFLIDTFPYGGGLVPLEAAANKVPIIGYSNARCPLFGNAGFLPEDYPFIARRKIEIIEYSEIMLKNRELRDGIGEILFRRYQAQYSPAVVKSLILSLIKGEVGERAVLLEDVNEEYTLDLDYINILEERFLGKKRFRPDLYMLSLLILETTKGNKYRRGKHLLKAYRYNEFSSIGETVRYTIAAIIGNRRLANLRKRMREVARF
ncbi:MAG: hypothetical protein C4575_09115 [Desulforudis sp.]|nr:MAG: hypothetical protein C4575_09115 [Desulforudis sp.]